MKATRFSAALVAALLFVPAGARAQAAKPDDHDHGHDKGQHGRGIYTFRLTPATGLAVFEGVTAAPRQDVLRVGTFTADGAGNVSGHTIATSDDGTTTVVIDFTWTGTYTINADGTGSLAVTTLNVTDASCTPAQAAGQCATFETPETYALVLNRHGEDKTVDLIETDNAAGGPKTFLTGQAKRAW